MTTKLATQVEDRYEVQITLEGVPLEEVSDKLDFVVRQANKIVNDYVENEDSQIEGTSFEFTGDFFTISISRIGETKLNP